MFDAEKMRGTLAAQIADDAQAGAALSVFIDGREVFNEAVGWADAQRERTYGSDSLQITMSIAKGVVATLLAMLIDEGKLEPEQRVSAYWPEFAAAGKRDVTVAQLFSHQAGLPLLDGGLSLALIADREQLAQRLAVQQPLWLPGTRHGYHAVTFGHYADLLFERASGRGLCELLGELRERLGVEIHCGLAPELRWRAVNALSAIPAPPGAPPGPVPPPESLPFKVLTNFPEMLVEPQRFFNSDALKDACVPATNMFASAHALARLYAGLSAGGVLDGRRFCSREAIALVTAERVRGSDAVNLAEMAYGLGVQKPSAFTPFSSNHEAYGHAGVGGSIAFADPRAQLSLAWMPSRFAAQPFDARMRAVIEAAYSAL